MTLRNPNDISTDWFNLLCKLWHHMPTSRKREAGFLSILIIASSFFEMFSLGSTVPFLGAIVSPEKIFNYPILKRIAQSFGIMKPDQVILPITITFILAAIFSGGTRLLLMRSTVRVAYGTGTDLSSEIYRRILYLPYQTHLDRNTSDVINTITRKVDNTTYMIYMMFSLISSIVLLISIIIVLVVISPVITMISGTIFGSFYLVITRFYRKRLEKNAQSISTEQIKVIKAIQEGLGGIRDILLDGTQPYYYGIFRQADRSLRLAMGDNFFIAGSPRFVLESLGMVLIAVLAYSLNNRTGQAGSIIPVLGAMALGAQRLLPILQLGYNAWAYIIGNQTSLTDMLKELEKPLPLEALDPPAKSLFFNNFIKCESVRFRYKNNSPWILDGINLNIRKGSKVGFVGSTGSGKTTLLDLLMGLIEPTEGKILVDGVPLTGNTKRSWQRTIAHVPQNIYLVDGTFSENIAFGIEKRNVDLERVKLSTIHANIDDFIVSQEGMYNGLVGERGIRISGGQRQRIGIARALYKQANVLILDEATSALDNRTEQDVMNAIESLGKNLTILMVAHRISTLRNCDEIIMINKGKILAQGNYDYLMENSKEFRELADVKRNMT